MTATWFRPFSSMMPPRTSGDDLARLHDGSDGRVVGDVGLHVRRALGGHRLLQRVERGEREMHRGYVRTVDPLVDLGALEAPGAHGQRHVLVAVVVVVERRALGHRVEHGQTDHGTPPWSVSDRAIS